MIYIGDGTTDIPCMKLVKQNGGHSIGVYDKNKSTVNQLMYDDRINFVCKADYTEGSELFEKVKDIAKMIGVDDKLRRQEYKDFKEAKGRLERGEATVDDDTVVGEK